MASLDDRNPWKPKYVRIADALRSRIDSGEFEPDDFLPSEGYLASEYNASPLTVRRALAILEDERLIAREAGVRARVREPVGEREVVQLHEGDRAITRHPTPEERSRLKLGVHELVTEIRRAGGAVEVLSALDVELLVEPAAEPEP